MKVIYTKGRWIDDKYYFVKSAICLDVAYKNTIVFITNYKIHNEYGAAVYRMYSNGIQKNFFYKGKEIYISYVPHTKYLFKSKINFSWKKRIKKIKREEQLKIFK